LVSATSIYFIAVSKSQIRKKKLFFIFRHLFIFRPFAILQAVSNRPVLDRIPVRTRFEPAFPGGLRRGGARALLAQSGLLPYCCHWDF